MKLDFKGKVITDYTKVSLTRKFKYKKHFITPKRLSNGNEKLNQILVFDLPAVETCVNCATCQKTCYALQAQLQYPDTKVFRNNNYFLAKNDSKILQFLIEKQLKNSRTNVIRVHGSGDFFSQDYINLWENIISKFPQKKFYTYTKAETVFNFNSIKKLKNFNLITSLIRGKLNYGCLEYCQMLNNRYNVFICPCGIDKDVKCGIDCNYCVTNKKVCFLIH